MSSATFVSTTIPYVNGRPHIGHALEYVQTDSMARYRRLRGDDVYFLTGSDDNSLKNVLAAEQEGLTPAALVARNVVHFQALLDALDVRPDFFIKTSLDDSHLRGATEMWKRLQANGDLYRREYAGLYCVGCELFYTPEELTPEGLCPEHFVAPEMVEEENWFFRLSRYGEALNAALDEGRLEVQPPSRLNELRAFIDAGLEDISVSRSVERARGWGIPVPGDDTQVMYVWIDALTNYVNALGWATGSAEYRRYWEQAERRWHVLGKGVLRFHGVYWPAMLLAADLPLPTQLLVHGYLTVDGRKIGKSLGNAVDPLELVGRWGPDPVRYSLLADVPPFADGDFSESRLIARYNNDLANGLGNLVNRLVSMTRRYRSGIVPHVRKPDAEHQALLDDVDSTAREFITAMEQCDHRRALGGLMNLVRRTNGHVDSTAPWHLAKAEAGGDGAATEKLDAALHAVATAVLMLGALLRAHLPAAATRITAAFSDPELPELGSPVDAAGLAVTHVPPVFPRLADDE